MDEKPQKYLSVYVCICVSSSSACSSGNTTPSHVLSAINTPKLYINSAIRSTFSDFNTFEEIDFLCEKLIKKLYTMSIKTF